MVFCLSIGVQLVTLNLQCSFYADKTYVTVQIYQFSDIRNMLKLTLKVLKTKSYNVFVDTVKGLLFIFDCATKYCLIVLS